MKAAACVVSGCYLKTMSKLILLDTGPLGIASNPRFSALTFACNRWLNEQARQGVQVLISEVADYEVRRELIRLNRSRSLARLDRLKTELVYLPISSMLSLITECFQKCCVLFLYYGKFGVFMSG